MSAIVYEEVALAEMTFEESEQMYYYECPCGDKFEISLEDLYDGEDIAPCPSCTLQIKVLFKEVCVLYVCLCVYERLESVHSPGYPQQSIFYLNHPFCGARGKDNLHLSDRDPPPSL